MGIRYFFPVLYEFDREGDWDGVVRAPVNVNPAGDSGDSDENGKKVIGLDWQNNNSARVSRFFLHFFSLVARLRQLN